MNAATDSTTRTHQMIFVNLPVADPIASKEFFAKLGYGFNEEMSNGTATTLELGPNHYAMLLERSFFDSFHQAASATAGQHEVLNCLTAETREEVDELVDRAIAAGGTEVKSNQSADFMYGRSYADIDGHIWEILWMDVEKARSAGTFG